MHDAVLTMEFGPKSRREVFLIRLKEFAHRVPITLVCAASVWFMTTFSSNPSLLLLSGIIVVGTGFMAAFDIYVAIGEVRTTLYFNRIIKEPRSEKKWRVAITLLKVAETLVNCALVFVSYRFVASRFWP